LKIRIEVVYALPDAQTSVGVELERGARVVEALNASNLQERLPGVTLAGCRIGIWGVPAMPDTELRDHDRVEIYRDLIADPKQARRQRVRQQRASKTRR
jgi:putative ubiquitin-RnfH superfamily antitoxin RatB of RatAB toxin-antitoxin module